MHNLVLGYIPKPNWFVSRLDIIPQSMALMDVFPAFQHDPSRFHHKCQPCKLGVAEARPVRRPSTQGRRTIGVLTKFDPMDAGTNSNDILTGQTYPLRLKFIGVVNLSQWDADAEKPLYMVLDREFAACLAYRDITHK